MRPDYRIRHPRPKPNPKQVRTTFELTKRLTKAGLNPTSIQFVKPGWTAIIVFKQDTREMPLLITAVSYVSRILRDMGNVSVVDVKGWTNDTHQIRVTLKLHRNT